jgi:cell division protease FtsH
MYTEDEGEVFLGHSVTQHKQMSDETAHLIDEEVRNLIDRNYSRAENILRENEDRLHKMAEALMRYETIDSAQIKDIMEGRDPRPPEGWDDSGATPGSGAPASEEGAGKGAKSPPKGEIGGPASQH